MEWEEIPLGSIMVMNASAEAQPDSSKKLQSSRCVNVIVSNASSTRYAGWAASACLAVAPPATSASAMSTRAKTGLGKRLKTL